MIIATKQKIKLFTTKKLVVVKSPEVSYTSEPCKCCGNKKN